MRSIISSQARNTVQNLARRRYSVPFSVIRLSSTESRKWSTPLAEQLTKAIEVTGPISLAKYMRMCLTSDMGAYYTSAQDGRDQFGVKGDFITSPEISQVFGELVGIWFIAEYMAQCRLSAAKEMSRSPLRLVEIGPGRGTLMDDMLRTMRAFPQVARNIEAVELIEASPALREAQRQLLCGDAKMIETSTGFQSTCKYGDFPVNWMEHIKGVPRDSAAFPFIVAHEFFDALPIHAFQQITQNSIDPIQNLPSEVKSSPDKSPEWREWTVTPVPPPSILEFADEPPRPISEDGEYPDFQLSLSSSRTPHSDYLPNISRRYKAAKNIAGANIEICPEAHAYAQEIANLIGNHSRATTDTTPRHGFGAALILDYGTTASIPKHSLRGFRNHKRVSPFVSPGLVDLSADVDFTAVAEAALDKSERVEVYGPVSQADFLTVMGIEERARRLMEGFEGDDKKRDEFRGAYQRLIDKGEGGMGKLYKAMAIVPNSNGRRKPVGFGGDVIS